MNQILFSLNGGFLTYKVFLLIYIFLVSYESFDIYKRCIKNANIKMYPKIKENKKNTMYFLVNYFFSLKSASLLSCLLWVQCFLFGVNALLVPTFLGHLYIGPYISVLLLLIYKMKNAFHFGLYRYLLNGNILRDKWSALLEQ